MRKFHEKKNIFAIRIIILLIIQTLMLSNCVWAMNVSTLSPKLEISLPNFQAAFQSLKVISSKHNPVLAKTDRTMPGKSKNIKQETVQSLSILKDKVTIYWNYYRPLYKKFRSLDFESREIKPVLKTLLKHGNIYAATRKADALYNLAKYMLSEELGFRHVKLIDLLGELSSQEKVRKAAQTAFDVIGRLQKEGFDGTAIQKIMLVGIPRTNIEERLEEIRYRLKKMELMQIDLWRKKEALIHQEYFEELLRDEADKARGKILSMFERLKQETQEPIEINGRVMQINIHALLTSRVSIEQIYKATLHEINFTKQLLANRVNPTKQQKKIIEDTNDLLSHLLSSFSLNFYPFPIYFVSDLAEGIFLPYYHAVASNADIAPKELFHELIHEGLHANAHGFIFTRLNEGMTEYWRNKLLLLNAGVRELTYEKIIEHHYDNFTDRYVPDLNVILLLLYNFGEEALFDAYFYGDNRALELALGPRVWEELKVILLRYEHADDEEVKEYPEKVEKLLKKHFPDLKTFDIGENETAMLNYLKPKSKIAAGKRKNNNASAVAARLKGSRIYPFNSRKGALDFGSGYMLDAEISEHDPRMVKVFLVRENQGQRSKEPVLLFKVDNKGIKDMSIALENVSFSGEGVNERGDDLTRKKLGIQLMSCMGKAVSAGMTVEGQVHNEQTRKELSAACYVDSSGRVRLKKVWAELADVGTKDRILFLTSPEYGAEDEEGDCFVVDDRVDLPGVDKEQKIHLQDILSRTVIGKLREAGGFFNHSISKITAQGSEKVKRRVSGVKALKLMLNNLERNEFMMAQGKTLPTFTLISEKTIPNSDRDIKKEAVFFADDKLMIQRKSHENMRLLEQAI